MDEYFSPFKNVEAFFINPYTEPLWEVGVENCNAKIHSQLLPFHFLSFIKKFFVTTECRQNI